MTKKAIGFLLIAWLLSSMFLWAHEGHEHASNIPIGVEWGLKGVQELINIHPLFVHFPIALLLTAAVLYLLGTLFRKEELFIAGKWLLYFGTASAAVTVWTGLQAANTVSHDEATHQLMMAHQYLGIGILALSAILSLWLLITRKAVPNGKIPFLLGLLLLTALIFQQADFGGRMVFLNGVGVGRKSMMQEQGRHAHGEHHNAVDKEIAHEHGSHAH